MMVFGWLSAAGWIEYICWLPVSATLHKSFRALASSGTWFATVQYRYKYEVRRYSTVLTVSYIAFLTVLNTRATVLSYQRDVTN